jgi:RNA polymerase sigma-70 factor (ECF subfamily)
VAAVTGRADEQLMRAYAAGDYGAFETLYDRYRGPLYRYVLHLLNDEPAANDVFQQTWEKVIRGAAGYRESTPFKAWVYVIARNNAMDHFRRVGRRREDELVETPADHATGPEQQADNAGRARNLAEAISQLPAEQADTLMLRLAAGMDLAAIARLTGVSHEAAKSRLRYAVSKLRQSLGDDDEH